MHKSLKRWVLFALRWGIAVVGIWWVLRNITLHDTVLVPDAATGRPVPAQVVGSIDDSLPAYTILDPATHAPRTVDRHDLLVRTGNQNEKHLVNFPNQPAREMEVLALRVADSPDRSHWPILVGPPRTVWQKYFNLPTAEKPVFVAPSQVAALKPVKVDYPLVDFGMIRIVRQASGWYLLLAVLVFPITFALVSFRWSLLVRLLGISISGSRTFVLTMVGLFYNNFMPGSTGGDLIKAYYASKNTPKRTAVILSVVIDRAIGLLALIVLGGTMAALHYEIPQCKKIAIVSAAILVCVALGLIVYYTPLRRWLGVDFILKRLPMQRQIGNAMQAMDLYGHHPWIMLGTLIMSLPVHATVIVSAMFAGKAFGLPLPMPYYWVAVPVIVLSGAVPISPQGAGVMEFFAILLTRNQGCTVTHAFLLTMSIRLVQMLWNLSGAIFVFRGGYSAPDDPVNSVETAIATE